MESPTARSAGNSFAAPGDGSIVPDLEELQRIHDISLELIERSHDLDGLLDRVLEEYERRLAELPVEALDGRAHPNTAETAKKLKALVMFASQAVALKTKAAAAVELRRRAQALSEANQRLQDALLEAQTARARLNGVLSSLDAGVLLVGPDGTVLKANPVAHELTGVPDDGLVGRVAPEILASVTRGGSLEIHVDDRSRGARVLLVSRRDVDGEGDEVVMITDITERHREIEERHRMEKLSEVLRTLSVLSHKINNPLTALLGRAQILQSRAGADPHVQKAASVIEESAQRIAELIRELATVVKEGRHDGVEKILDMKETGMPEAKL